VTASETRPGGLRAGQEAFDGAETIVPARDRRARERVALADQIVRRLVADAYTEGASIYWRRRARQIADALPRPGDYLGRATVAEVEARITRLEARVAACERHAALLGEGVDHG
jgi:hypothetical protein